MWDGGALLNDNWSDPKNWEGDVAPQNGDDLQFGGSDVSPNDLDTVNDFPTGRLVGNILIRSGFTLRGNQITLKSGANITAEGSSLCTIALGVRFNPGDHRVIVDGPQLQLNGAISNTGTGSLTYDIVDGSLEWGGNGANTYNQPVFLPTGVFRIRKLNGADAFAGPVTIGDATLESAEVKSFSTGAFKAGTAVTIVGGTDAASILNIGSGTESLGRLTLTDALVTGTSTGKLILTDRVADTPENGSSNIADVIIDLNSANREFAVESAIFLLDNKVINGGIRKTGDGNLILNAGNVSNTFAGGVLVESGLMVISGNQGVAVPSGNVTVLDAAQVTAANNQALGDGVSVIVDSGTFVAAFNASQSDRLKSVTVQNSGLFGLSGGANTTVTDNVVVTGDSLLSVVDATLTVNGELSLTASRLDATDETLNANGGVILKSAEIEADQLRVDKFVTVLGADDGSRIDADLGINRKQGARTPFRFNIGDGAAEVDLDVVGLLSNVGVAAKIEKTGPGRLLLAGGSVIPTPLNLNQGALDIRGSHHPTSYAVGAGRLEGDADFNVLSATSQSTISPGISALLAGDFQVNSAVLNGSRLILDLNGLDPSEVDSIRTPTLNLQNNPILDVRLNTNVSLGDTFELITGLTAPVTGRFKDPTGNVLEEGRASISTASGSRSATRRMAGRPSPLPGGTMLQPFSIGRPRRHGREPRSFSPARSRNRTSRTRSSSMSIGGTEQPSRPLSSPPAPRATLR